MMVYELEELIKMYEENTLPEGEKVFRYKASFGLEKWIHVDEVKIQANFKNIYPKERFIEGFRGIVNKHHGTEPQPE